MMEFWAAALVMLALVVLALLRGLRPGLARTDAGAVAGTAAPVAADDVAFFHRQIAEVERQAALGLIGTRDAEAARTEAARRLLAAEKAGARPARTATPAVRRALAASVLVVVPALSLALYGLLGSPDSPSEPLAARRGQPGPEQVTLAIQRMEQHLARNPQDGAGYEVLAPVYLRMGRLDDALAAQRRALEVLGESADRQANLGEILVYKADGTLTPDAKAAFERAVALEPKTLKARVFLARGAMEAGDRDAALALFRGLAADVPDGPLRQEFEARIASLSGAAPDPAAAAIAALPPADRSVAIRGMVEALAIRLSTEGGGPDDWARLIRSLRVLGDIDRAAMILGEARQKFAANAAALADLEEAGRTPVASGSARP